jgi:hypothetical protein
MKKFFYTIAVIVLANTGVFAQSESKKIEGISAKIEKGDLMINWTGNQSSEGYWQVQGSTDGKSYTTIGMVMGQDPAKQNAFKFKQPVAKLKPGMKYYRVLLMESAETGIASNSIQLSK